MAKPIKIEIVGDSSKFSAAVTKANSSMASLGKVGIAGVAAIGVAAAGAGAALFQVGSKFDEASDAIRVGTGATGEALEGLENSFQNVLKTVPTNFGDASAAIADLNTRLGLTGEPLEDLSGQFINLSRITKTDVAGNIDRLTRVFGDWGVSTEDQAKSMDKLFRASQASGIGIDELGTSLVSFGAPLRNVGFSMDESTALLAVFNKTGVNTETVIAGLKAGVGKLAKAGEDVPEVFRRVVDEITALGPGSEATAKAIELFGQRAGPDLADAIAGGKFELDEMLAAIQGGEDTINQAAKDTESFGEKWTLIKNRVFVGLEPLATRLFDGIGKAMDKMAPFVDQITAGISAFAYTLQSGFTEDEGTKIEGLALKVRELGARLLEAGKWLQENVLPIVVAFGEFIVTDLVPAVQSFATTVAEEVVPRVKELISQVRENLGPTIEAFTDYWNNALKPALLTVVGVIRDHVLPFLGKVADIIISKVVPFVLTHLVPAMLKISEIMLGTVIPALVEFVAYIVEKILPFIEKFVSALGDIIAEGIAVHDEILGNFNAVVDFIAGLPQRVKDAARGLWDGIPKPPSFITNGASSVLGRIPGFAGGTNFAPGGLAVVGERGPEIVNLPRGSQVTPNHEIGGNSIVVNVMEPAATADHIAYQIGWALRTGGVR